DLAHGLDELGVCGVLQHVPGGAGREGLAHVRGVVLHREHQDARVGRLDPDLGRGVDPARAWHDHVEEDDIGRELARQLDGLLAVAGLADRLEVVLALQEQAQARPDHRVVVDDQDADHAGTSTTSVVPWSVLDSTRSDPPRSSARSRIDTRPSPWAGVVSSNPVPLSSTIIVSRSPSRRVTMLTADAPA